VLLKQNYNDSIAKNIGGVKMNARKYAMIVGLIGIMSFSLVGCKANAEVLEPSQGIPVEAISVEEVNRQVDLKYKGMVVPEDQVAYAFKTGGRLETLNVKPGDSVKVGDVLATMENTDLSLQLSSASAQLQSAQKDVKKAEESWAYNKDQLDKMKQLYESGGISKNQLDQMQLNYDISESSLAQAREGSKAAQAGYEINNRLLDEAVLIAKEDGVVLGTEFEVGELMGAQKPVVMMRSETQVVQVGVSETDIDSIAMETPVVIEDDGLSFEGVIVEINDVPDMATRTYLVKVRVEGYGFRIGAITDVAFTTGNEDGVWIPTTAVLSDGEKFVYVVEEGRAFKRTVAIAGVNGFELQIEGVKPGTEVVVGGMKKLTDGTEVVIVEAE